MLTECSFEIPRLVLPKSGFASLVLGILSVTTCEKTVSDSSIVTPESIYASKITFHLRIHISFSSLLQSHQLFLKSYNKSSCFSCILRFNFFMNPNKRRFKMTLSCNVWKKWKWISVHILSKKTFLHSLCVRP